MKQKSAVITAVCLSAILLFLPVAIIYFLAGRLIEAVVATVVAAVAAIVWTRSRSSRKHTADVQSTNVD